MLAFLPLNEAPALLPEQELWQVIPPLLDPMTPLDVGIPKVGAEYLVVGDACSPGGEMVKGLELTARVGELRKSVYAIGQRYWLGRNPSDPIPFARQPTGWSHAFGGQGFAENPMGRGLDMVETPAGVLQSVPCIESPRSPCVSPQSKVQPISFAPIPPMWPQRKRFDGTYDDAWMKNLYPAPPADFDWRFHGLASEDQWQPQPFTGTEVIEIGHMHPDFPLIRHTLPGIKAVVVTRLKGMPPEQARFSDARLTTLWLFPNQLRMVMIWQALMEVDNEFADDVELLMVAAEWIDRPKPQESYVHAINARLDEEEGALKLLDDHELLPEGLATPNEMMEHFLKSLSGDVSIETAFNRLHESQAQFETKLNDAIGQEAAAAGRAALGHELQAIGMKAPVLPKTLPTTTQGIVEMGRELLKTLPPDAGFKEKLLGPQAAIAAQLSQAYQAVGAEAATVKAVSTMPPATGVFSPLREVEAAEKRLAAMPLAEGVTPLTMDPKLKQAAQEADRTVMAMQRGVAHMQPPPPPLEADMAARWREGAARARAAGHSFAGLKLRAADFSGMDLSGVDFSDAELDGVNFVGANLEAANFSNASLAHANLEGAKVDGASFEGTNLGRARLVGASCNGCCFKDATLHFTVLDGTVLSGSDFSDVTLNEVQASKTVWNAAKLAQSTFIKCTVLGAEFARAVLSKATFLETNLAGARFVEARVDSTDFVTCLLDDSVFDGCNAVGVRFVYHTSLCRASFKNVTAQNANFRGTPLEGADFTGACLDGSDFSEAVCPGGRFLKSSLKGALLMKGQFQKAVFVEANLMNVILQHAQLQGADFSGANLYAADLMRVDADTDTRLDHAFIAKARMHPQRKVQSSRAEQNP